MAPQRLSIKLFFTQDQLPEANEQIAMFHRWIRDKKLNGLLIDVADYAHVPEGPGIMLIGHEADYAIDRGSGGPGLMVTRKRIDAGDLTAAVKQTCRLALAAAEALADESLSAPMEVATDRMRVLVLDRLQYPSEGGDLQGWVEQIGAAVSKVAGSQAVAEPVPDDGRGPVTVDLKITEAISLQELSQRAAAAAS
ncbi:MAG: hypothetical protein R3236_09080 [Phycisphaeraceae bacterium]|nr:hypothetical protein [Phycisphaeraceae bacterium]